MAPLESIGSALEGLVGAIQNKFNQVLNYIYDLINKVVTIVDYLNPLSDRFLLKPLLFIVDRILDYINPASENFLLKLAFIPSEGFIESELYSLKDDFFDKFDFIGEIRDGISSFAGGLENVDGDDFGISAEFDLGFVNLGEFSIVDGRALQEYGEKLRFWLGSLIYLLTGAYLIRELNEMLR